MVHPLTQERLETWVSDFCLGDQGVFMSAACAEWAPSFLLALMTAACDAGDVEPEDVEEKELRGALLEHVARLDLPGAVHDEVVETCASFLMDLEPAGRLAGGRRLGLFLRTLAPDYARRVAGKGDTIVRPGKKIGRNEPCPCGSGKKFKACCMRKA